MALDLKALADELDDLRTRRDDEDQDDPLDDGELERLKALEALENEIGDLHLAYRNQGPFIADGKDWEEYAEETAYDVGLCQRGSTIANYVDWERWAEDLKMDYSSVEFDGETYWYRN